MKYQAAIIQTASTDDPEQNLKQAETLLREAAELHGARLAVFPEYLMCQFHPSVGLAERRAAAERAEAFTAAMCALARQYGVYLVFGTLEPSASDGRCRNTTVLTDDCGRILARYYKTHLYDAASSRESDFIAPGDRLFEPVDTPFGRLGIFVCYEVRFPEIARYLRARGAQLLIMPTAWVAGERKSLQFETLIRARAIENGVYLLAADQCDRRHIGESIAVGPMGETLARAGTEPCVLPFTLDPELPAAAQRAMPSFLHRRPELYGGEPETSPEVLVMRNRIASDPFEA